MIKVNHILLWQNVLKYIICLRNFDCYERVPMSFRTAYRAILTDYRIYVLCIWLRNYGYIEKCYPCVSLYALHSCSDPIATQLST